MKKNKLVSVVVPTRNSAKTLEDCLVSINKQTYLNIELLVVDRDSVDRTKEIANHFTKKVFNHGPERSWQRNYAASKARGEFIIFIDSDMVLSKSVIEECVELMKDPSVTAVAVPEESFGAGFWAQCKRVERKCNLEAEWLDAARFFRLKDFLMLGGYDTSMISGEDWDLSQRFESLGRKVRIKSFIYHNEGNPTLWQIISKKFYYAKKFSKYTYQNRNSKYLAKQSSVFLRYWILLKQPDILFKEPLVGLGVLIMKTLEFGFGIFGYLYGKAI